MRQEVPRRQRIRLGIVGCQEPLGRRQERVHGLNLRVPGRHQPQELRPIPAVEIEALALEPGDRGLRQPREELVGLALVFWL